MARRYLISIVLASFFSLTTVILALLSRQGVLTTWVSPGTALLILVSNFTLLVVSLTFFIWQRTHKQQPKHDVAEQYQRYAAVMTEEAPVTLPTSFTVSDKVFARLRTLYEPVDITLSQPTNHLMTGDTIRLIKHSRPAQVAIVEVSAISDHTVTVRPTYLP